jgi:glutamate-1-semialdehyde aminotransferase
MPHRQKLSTTIGPDNYAYLRRLVKTGKAASIGEAVDKAVELARQAENRTKLAQATAAYFSGLSSKAAKAEAALETALSDASVGVDFDQP